MSDSTPSRRQQAEGRREQILDAAVALFSEKGIDGTSVRDIARAVGVTEGLLYHYFEGKDALARACWVERSWKQHFERMVQRASAKPLRAALASLLTDMMHGIYDSGSLVRMHMAEMLRDAEKAEAVASQAYADRMVISAFLSERQKQGEVGPGVDAETLAWVMMGYVHAIFLLEGRAERAEWGRIVEEHVGNLVTLLAVGVAPAGDQWAPAQP